MSGGSRVPIPKNVQKTIQNIKEIAGNHSDEEVYAMLKECSMDPNETAQKLLLQDTFHEVKRKRDRKKENVTNREATESRWRPSTQGRGGRGVRGSYSSRFVSHDAGGGGKNSNTGKDESVNQGMDAGAMTTTAVFQEVENKGLGRTSSMPPGMTNGPTSMVKEATVHGHASQVVIPEETLSNDVNRSGNQLPSADTKSNTSVVGGAPRQAAPNANQFVPTVTPTSVSGVYSSASDPVLVPSLDTRNLGIVGTIKREVGSQRTSSEPNKVIPHGMPESSLSSSFISEKVSSEVRNPFMQGKIHGKSSSDVSQLVSASSHSGSASSRPSSNYGSRSQQVIGPQKVGPSKEWKPKSTSSNVTQPSGTIDASETTTASVEDNSRSIPASSAVASEESTLKLQKKLEDLNLSDTHVIIPNHLQVPEAERTGLSFGSFDASFGVRTSFTNGHDSDKSSTPLSESSQGIEETAEESSSSNQNASPAVEEGEYPNHPQSSTHMQENLLHSEPDASSAISPGPEYDPTKPETALPPGGPHYSVVHTAPNYSTFGLVPPMLGNQFSPFESSEPQARDATRIPSFVVQQPFDPSTNYYTQFYRPGADGDGRFSPFLAAPGPAAPAKYNGNVAVLSTQTAQSPQQETGSSLVLSTAGPTPLANQAGVMQSSIAVTQQPVPVFRQPAGVHISHYPPNYIPYSQYFSPFYVPPPAIHHFLSNTAFPQQPPTGGIYPAAATGATTAVKYSLSQYKPGTNTGNSTHIGMPAGYGPYTSAPSGYSPSSAVSSGNSAGSEDLSASQYKENNVYMTGQQSEGSAMWIPAPGRDIPGLQASSFYNLPPQGQHVTFAPTQAGHGAFAGIYHPAQTVAAAHPLLQQSQTMAGAVEMVGPPAGVYQQPQRSQINWAHNY
ncbi:GBF-interacting protein 1-like isoform X2 [Aristolochia californica]|uniref:GBF-interacting protein 1-like isoform X2 n=1 Tax=Aristolochia californica TaxID=171875 RepID=UPI0035DE6666